MTISHQGSKHNPPTQRSNEELINHLHEKVLILSDIIGFNLAATNNLIPERYIDAPSMAERLLIEGQVAISDSLGLIQQIEQQLLEKPQPKAKQ